MGAPNIQQPTPPPQTTQESITATQIAALQKAETDRLLRESRGRRGAFLFDAPASQPAGAPSSPLAGAGTRASPAPNLPRRDPRLRGAGVGGRPPGSTPILGG